MTMTATDPAAVIEEVKPSSSKQALTKALAKLEIWLLYAYLVSIPLSITATWVIFIAGACVRVCLIAIDRQSRTESILRVKQAPLLVPLILFTLCVGLAGAFNSAPAYGQPGEGWLKEALESMATLKNILPYLWCAVALKNHKERAATGLAMLLLVSSIAGIWGTIQQVFNIHPGYKYLQGTGFLGAPMAFAGQMQLLSVLALGFMLNRAYDSPVDPDAPRAIRSIYKCTANGACFTGIVLANYLGVLFAGERSAWLGAAAGSAMLCWLHWRKIPLKAMILAGTLAAICCCTVPLVKVRIESLFSGKDVSISARMTIWRACMELIPQSPAFGVGIRRFPHFDIPEAIVPGVSRDLNHAHSNYFHILTSTGILGFTAFCGIFLSLFATGFRCLNTYRQRADKLSLAITSALMAGAASLLISGIFEYNFGTAQIRLAQWFLMGLL